MGLAPVTVEGRLAADPELKFLQSGAAVCNFRIAHTERKMNQQTQQWEDGATLWFPVTAWRGLAENCAESLHKGDAVIVYGDLTEEEWENREGQKQVSKRINAKWVGPSLSNATVTINRPQRQQGGQPQQQGDPWTTSGQQQQAPTWGQGWGSQQPQQGNPNQNPPANPNQGQGGWGQQQYDQPPF